MVISILLLITLAIVILLVAIITILMIILSAWHYLSNATCLTQVFFTRGESCGEFNLPYKTTNAVSNTTCLIRPRSLSTT